MVLLILCCFYLVLEIRAEEAAVTLYGLKGHMVCLDAGVEPPYESPKWTYETTILASTKVNPDFINTIHYYESNATLCIEKLRKNDSGVYQFSFDRNFKHKSNKYRLIVQEAVPQPVLTITQDQVNSSNHVCISNVNCSVQNDWLWSVCDEDRCQTPSKSFPEFNISISTNKTRVICTAYNYVSKKIEIEIGECTDSPSDVEHQEPYNPELILIVVCLGVILFTLVIVLLGAKILISTRQKNNQPPQVIQSQPMEPYSFPRVSVTSSNQDEASYENVDPENSTTLEENSQIHEEEKIDTTYCVLQPPQAAAAKDTEMDKSSEIHTIYSMIKKP